jgi:hypothetical protein
MKKTALFALGMIFSLISFAQPNQNNKKIQVGILFDTSNSMDGLIDQAKSRIWNIVNEVSSLTYNGLPPTIEFAIYQYGNDGLSSEDHYIKQVLDLTSDLDLISQKLFGLTTNGGSEFCGAVIQESLNDLNWSTNQNDLKMIYIAGNEGFDQGPIDYMKSCANASNKNVFINTIFCGDYNQGVQLKWHDGAVRGNGDYFNIDSDKAIAQIKTPYDEEIRAFNDSINTTYYGYGNIGLEKKAMQLEQDSNAAMQSESVATERAISKSKKSAYKNESWDLLDAVEGGKEIEELEDAELPDDFKGLSDEAKKEKIEGLKANRDKYQTKIEELAKKRQEFIDEEMKKKAELGESDDFGTSVNESITKKANSIGFEKE